MAGALGDLVIALHADIAKFTSDMGRAAQISEREWGKVAKSATEVAKQVTAAAALAGAAAIKMAADFINAAADLDDLAEKTGASVEELSKLAQQAHISGVAMETIETGLIRLAKSLHASDEESKKATRALDALGLKADELKGKDTAAALRIVATELNKYADGSSKAALAMDLFGKSGAQLLPLLKDMATEGELNVRVTAQQAAEAEELGKSWRRLTNDARGVGQAMALDLIPWLQRTVTELHEGTKAAGGFWSALLVGATINPFKSLQNNLVSYREELRRLESTGFGETRMAKLRRAQIEMLERQQRSEALSIPGRDTTGEMQRFGLAGQKAALSYESAATAAKGAKKAYDELGKAAKESLALASRMHSADLKAMEDYRKQIEHFRERQYFVNIFGEAETAGMSLDDLQKKLKSTVDAAQSMSDRWDSEGLMDAGFDETGKKIDVFVEKNAQAATETHEFWRSAFESMQRSASDLFFDVMQGNFSDFGTRFKQTIDRMVADWLAAQALMEATAYAKRAINGSTNMGTFVGSILNAIGGTQSGADVPVIERGFPHIPEFAEGTDFVPRTGLALLHQGEAVLTREENMNRSRGGDINITVYTPNADSFRASSRQIVDDMRRLAFAG